MLFFFLVQLGTNYIAAEVHMSYFRKPTSAFDLQLIRNAIVDCPASATNCVRTVEQGILEVEEALAFLVHFFVLLFSFFI